MIKGGRVTIRTDHKLLLEIVAGMAKSQNSAAADKFHHWTSDILAGDPHPTIQYKKGSLNLIAASLSRLRTGDHYKYKYNECRLQRRHTGSHLTSQSPQTLDHHIHTQILWTSRRRQMLQQN